MSKVQDKLNKLMKELAAEEKKMQDPKELKEAASGAKKAASEAKSTLKEFKGEDD